MKRIKQQRAFLEVLSKGNINQRKGVIDGANKELINCICEICLNILRGNLTITSKQKQHLKHHRTLLHKLADKQTPFTKRKRLIQQNGGFLPLSLTQLLSLLGSVAAKAISKHI